ncbi:unnamed protein product, partial [Heterosigma akashiwo]
KEELLEAVSFTQNGKMATPSKQIAVLKIVRDIETAISLSETDLSDPKVAERLDGVWYLQYTSPSEVDGQDDFEKWTPISGGEEVVPATKKYKAKGSVSAAGINVDTSNRVVKQIFDMRRNEVSNQVNFNWGKLAVGGPFRLSENVSNRALVSFKNLQIELKNGTTLNLDFVFTVLATLRGTDVGGWLETTYLGNDIRIGRGDKGTMFVLTRDPGAVI